jgi:hypothetical protein
VGAGNGESSAAPARTKFFEAATFSIWRRPARKPAIHRPSLTKDDLREIHRGFEQARDSFRFLE